MATSEQIDLGRPLQSSNYRPSPRRLVGQTVLHLILLTMSFVSITPFVWMIFASFKHFQELVRSTALLPKVWTLENYIEIIGRVNFIAAFSNSTIQATSVTLCSALTSAAPRLHLRQVPLLGEGEALHLTALDDDDPVRGRSCAPLYHHCRLEDVQSFERHHRNRTVVNIRAVPDAPVHGVDSVRVA